MYFKSKCLSISCICLCMYVCVCISLYMYMYMGMLVLIMFMYVYICGYTCIFVCMYCMCIDIFDCQLTTLGESVFRKQDGCGKDASGADIHNRSESLHMRFLSKNEFIRVRSVQLPATCC